MEQQTSQAKTHAVRITSTIANEFEVRSVHDEIGEGVNQLDEATVRELLSDAEFQQTETDGTPLYIRRAYAALAAQCRKALEA